MFVLRSIQLTLWQKLVLVVVIAGGAALIPAVGSTGGPLPIVDFNVTTAPATSDNSCGPSPRPAKGSSASIMAGSRPSAVAINS